MQNVESPKNYASGLAKLGLAATRSSDIFLAVLIVSVIGLMILPLPTLLVDTLVAANIALGVMLVLMAIYVNSALQFSAFPSVLLISTLFRLALSVATTRMILLNGDAGSIIDTFGQMVAGGNLVVGLVVFLIITLVQFLVIAKGAERVAEVGARFTLDAMPGKQLSIDSDLRSGLIDKVEARRKRADLEKESQLHGSLDGAMKFVKGDAIAGIVVIIVNLLGGLAVGVFQVGMSAGDAMGKYSILTIGDGLVAQIPALFGAMAAGLIVTRVSDAESTEHLGDAIQHQFTAIPRVLLVAGAMCVFFSLVPGFPTGVFLTLGFIMLFTGSMLLPAFRVMVNRYSTPAFDTIMQRKERIHRSTILSTNKTQGLLANPLELSVPRWISAEGGDVRLRNVMQSTLDAHYFKSGVILPTLKMRWADESDRDWRLEIHEVPVCSGVIEKPEDTDEIPHLCLDALRRNVNLFLGVEAASRLLSTAADLSPEVVTEIQRSLPLHTTAALLRNLAEEEVPIRNLTVALEGLVQASQQEKNPDILTEFARIALGRQICNKYASGTMIPAVGLSLEVEEFLLQSVRASDGIQELGASPMFMSGVALALDEALKETGASVVVVPVVLRKHIRTLISTGNFDTGVLSYPEIKKPFELDILKRVVVDVE